MNIKKIFHIVAYYPPHLGGMENVVENLATLQASQGLFVQVVTSNIGASASSIHDVVPVRRLKAVEFAHTPIIPGLLTLLLSTPSQSIFHVHVAQAGVPEIAFLAARLKRSKIIMHIHSDVEASGLAGILLKPYKKIFLSHALRLSDVIILPTEELKVQIANKYRVNNKTFVVPAGVDDSFFIKKNAHIDSTKPTQLIYVGRLSREKNVPLIIKAVGLLASPAVLTIVGDGAMKAEIENEIRILNSSLHEIKLVGHKTQDEVIEYYKHADIALIASDSESQSLVALEAMASGTALIFAPLPAVKPMIGNSGIEVEKTPEAFAEAISELMNHRDRLSKLGYNGRLRARQYTWSDTTKKLMKIYQEL